LVHVTCSVQGSEAQEIGGNGVRDTDVTGQPALTRCLQTCAAMREANRKKGWDE